MTLYGIDVTGIRNKRWQWRKNDAVILVVLVACTKFGVKGQSIRKLLCENWISIFSNSDLDLDHIHLGSNPKLPLGISYPYSKFGVNSPKQTKVIEQKLKVNARMPARPPAALNITITRFSLKTWLTWTRGINLKLGRTELRFLCTVYFT